MRLGRHLEMTAEPATVNGQPGALVRAGNGELVTVVSLDIADGRVQAIRNILNPDKLRHLGPVGDLNALMRTAP